MPRTASPRPQIVNVLEVMRNEIVAVGHFHFGQTRGVDDLGFGDDFVVGENECRQSVNVAAAKRPLLLRRHGAVDVVPYRGGKGPVIGKRP